MVFFNKRGGIPFGDKYKNGKKRFKKLNNLKFYENVDIETWNPNIMDIPTFNIHEETKEEE